MKLIIRCDDVSYFTKPEELEYWFKDIWDKVPIKLAVIPHIFANGNETPLEQRGEYFKKISDNNHLIRYLKIKLKQKKIDIWQHGATHITYNGKFECENLSSSSLYYGKAYLESIFNKKIKVFVAPHDRFCKRVVKLIERLKMDICRAYSPLPREFIFRKEYFFNCLKHFKNFFWNNSPINIIKLKGGDRFNYWMNFGKHKELYSYRIGEIDNIDDILKWHKKGILCITVHHRSMNTHDLEKLKYIVERCDNGRKTFKKRVSRKNKNIAKRRTK